MLPPDVRRVLERAEAAGFALSCDHGAGRLLQVLVAAIPRGGSALELGTGAGVGLAWMLSGLGERTDVRITSAEIDPTTAALAAGIDWPAFVTLEKRDALEILRRGDRWDLIFADAQGGKWEGLDDTIDALAPQGVLLVDDMTPPEFVSDVHRVKTAEVREQLLHDSRLAAVEIDWSSGLILSTRLDG
ncbi:MAG: O-methyltransferase [Acidimicrobiales bacterium]